MKYVLGAFIGASVLGVGYYTLSPLWNVKNVDDALPILGIEHLSGETQREMMMQLIEANKVAMDRMDDSMPKASERGPFVVMDTPLHPASGSVRIFSNNAEHVVRFENFKTINGPRVHVYLAKDLDAKEFIDLGPIRGTEGNINYTVPSGINVDEYPFVMHWCVPFGVLFNYAKLQ